MLGCSCVERHWEMQCKLHPLLSLWRVSVYICTHVNSVYLCLSSLLDPTISVSVDAGVATLTAEATYSLTCTVTGAERLTGSTITYQWFKDGVVVSGQTMETLSFTPLTFSDAGGYTCEATVMSSLLSDPITSTSSSSVDITLTCKPMLQHLLSC